MRDNHSIFEDPNAGGQNAGMNDLIQARKRNLDTVDPFDSLQPITRFQFSQFDQLSHNRLAADASELEHAAGDQIELVLPIGEILRYKLTHTERDAEGDIFYWEYTCSTSKFKIVIFND